MISAIKNIGNCLIKENNKDIFDIVIENFNEKGYYNSVITVVLKVENGNYKYSGVEVEQFQYSNVIKYLYRKGSPRGVNFSPTTIITNKVLKSYDNKFLGWFLFILKNSEIQKTNDDVVILNNICKELTDNKIEIIDKIEDVIKTTGKSEGYALTLKIDNEDQKLYLGDLDLMKKHFISLLELNDSKICSSNKTCSVCGKVKEKVVGNLNVYKFYTLDKPGFITGGFKKEDSWKNYPVCYDCKMKLDEGKRYVESNLTFKFCGIVFQLIPKIINQEKNKYKEILKKLELIKSSISNKEYDIKIMQEEECLFSGLKDMPEYVNFDMLFIKKSNAAEKIMHHIENINVKDIKKIIDAKKKIDEDFSNPFYFKTIRKFYIKSDVNSNSYDLDNYFLSITKQIMKNREINKYLIYKFLMNNIRVCFKNSSFFHQSVNDATKVIVFFRLIGIIDLEVICMDRVIERRVFDDYFDKLGSNAYEPLKKGLIILGSLNELLLRRQYNLRDAKPYMKHLKSLRMSEKDFKGLLPKVQNKLEEYGSFDDNKRMLAKEAANYLLRSGDDWQMSTDELNFYFAAGMNLADELYEEVNKG